MSRAPRRHPVSALTLAVALAAASAVPGAASASEPGEPSRIWATRQAASPVDRIIEQVERRHRAHVVRVGQEEVDGRLVYVLRLLSDQGRVWTVRVDAESGREF